MDDTANKKVAGRAGDLVSRGYYWSVGIVLAVGEHLWGGVDEVVLRMSSGLAGGVGCSQEELCGALSGGAMLIGGVYGRTGPDQDNAECNRLVCAYRDRFTAELGITRCFDLRESGFGSEGKWPCSMLVERAAGILLEVLDEARP